MIKPIYDPNYEVYRFDPWEIEKVGGHITLRRWTVINKLTHQWFWAWTKKSALERLERIINDPSEFRKIDDLYTKPLY